MWPKPLPEPLASRRRRRRGRRSRRITSGSCIGRRRCSRTRRARSGAPRRRCWSSIQQGNLVSSWGGPGAGYEWPDLEHGIYVDGDNVWLGGGGEKDAQILKFTRQGKFLMQIGRKGKNTGSNDTQNLGGAANMTVDRAANELYVADGYVNHRVIVFDATTGAYKRHWGAYGKKPDDCYFTQAGERLPSPFSGAVQHENKPSQYDPDGPPPPQFRIVHAVRIARDGLVYVCDRTNDRIQVFRKDGTFVKEAFVAKKTLGQRIGVGHRVLDRSRADAIWSSTTAPISRSGSCVRETLQVVSAFGQARAIGPGSSTARTISPSTRRAISSSAKPTKESAFRSSSIAAWDPRRRRLIQVTGGARCANEGVTHDLLATVLLAPRPF